MTKADTLSQLRDAGVVAVLRAPDGDGALRAVDALLAGGIRAIEITYTTPDAAEVIASLARRCDTNIVLGAGTVLTPQQATEAAGAGAQFIVTPGTNPALADAVVATGVASVLGAFTPSEVIDVLSLEADVVKIFPASVGGPRLSQDVEGSDARCGPDAHWWSHRRQRRRLVRRRGLLRRSKRQLVLHNNDRKRTVGGDRTPCGGFRRGRLPHTLMNDSRPHMGFVGVSTGGSSIMKIFPEWAHMLGLSTDSLVGYDLPLDTLPDQYRELVETMAAEPSLIGALVTTHKMGVFEAASDLFDHLDEHALRFGEISSISKRSGALIGHAKDPITARLSIEEFLAEDHFSVTGGSIYCLGVGGAGAAISYYLGERSDRPSAIVCTDTSQARLDHAATIHQAGSTPDLYHYALVTGPDSTDLLLAGAPDGSLIVNATGMGKDLPGSPISDSTPFPLRAVVWELNYRGPLDFLVQARRQQQARGLLVVDGWRYFIHGWTQVIAEVFDIPMPADTVERLATYVARVQT